MPNRRVGVAVGDTDGVRVVVGLGEGVAVAVGDLLTVGLGEGVGVAVGPGSVEVGDGVSVGVAALGPSVLHTSGPTITSPTRASEVPAYKTLFTAASPVAW